MSTQQDIYATGSENRPHMLNKYNYVPRSSHLLYYAESKPNGKLIYNSIMHGPYFRRMIPIPGNPDREVHVAKTFHEQTDEELTNKEVKKIEEDDQAIQTILMGLPEDIYAAVDNCQTAQEIWLRVQQMLKGSDIGVQEKKAKLFNEWERITYTDEESIVSYYHCFSKLMNDFKRNKHFPKKIASNLKISNPNANQNRNGNVVAKRAEGNDNGNNENQIRDLDEIKEVNANCILMANLQQALTSGTQNGKALVYDSDGSSKAKSREELYFLDTSKMASVSNSVFKSISIPNEEFSDDTSPSVARKFLNEVKITIVTLQRVVKQKMTLDIHNWSSSTHQELHNIVKDKNFPIVNQVDARVQNFKIQFLKEAAKFVRDFKSLAKEANESLAKHKALEYEIEHLLRAVVSQDITLIVQNHSVVDTSNLQIELDRMKEKLET
nr:hypothetical protein [Tanacetum cinerariifolium]